MNRIELCPLCLDRFVNTLIIIRFTIKLFFFMFKGDAGAFILIATGMMSKDTETTLYLFITRIIYLP